MTIIDSLDPNLRGSESLRRRRPLQIHSICRRHHRERSKNFSIPVLATTASGVPATQKSHMEGFQVLEPGLLAYDFDKRLE